jgi:hypothetical protein
MDPFNKNIAHFYQMKHLVWVVWAHFFQTMKKRMASNKTSNKTNGKRRMVVT